MWIGYILVWLQCDLDVMWFGFSVDFASGCGMMGCSVDLVQCGFGAIWIGCSVDEFVAV